MPGPFLVAYDGSEASRAALAFATERARATKAKIVLVNVIPQPLARASMSEIFLPTIDIPKLVKNDSFAETARKNLQAVVDEAKKSGIDVEGTVRVGDAADEIIEAAREAKAEQIVLGFKGYEKRLPYGLGSVADKVVRYADRTVTVIRP